MKLWPRITIALLFIAMISMNSYKNSYVQFRQTIRPITWAIKTFLFHPTLLETPDTQAIAHHLQIYQVYDESSPILLKRIGRAHDGGYVIPELAIQKADAMFGYGISDDISFEEEVSTLYGKPSWGFDGSCSPIATKHPLCQFIPLYIASNHFMTEDHIHKEQYISFDQQIQRFDLQDKKLFIKMDIEGNEYDTLPDILQHAPRITGIVLELHFDQAHQIPKARTLMKQLQNNFLLVHVHGNNYCLDRFVTKNAEGYLPRVLELSYINKNLVHKFELSSNQAHPTPLDMPNMPDVADAAFTILNKESNTALFPLRN